MLGTKLYMHDQPIVVYIIHLCLVNSFIDTNHQISQQSLHTWALFSANSYELMIVTQHCLPIYSEYEEYSTCIYEILNHPHATYNRFTSTSQNKTITNYNT